MTEFLKHIKRGVIVKQPQATLVEICVGYKNCSRGVRFADKILFLQDLAQYFKSPYQAGTLFSFCKCELNDIFTGYKK